MSNENLASIVSPVINELIIIKDANGLVYWPQIPVYTLDNFNTEDAYAIKTYASNELVIYGDFTQPEDVLGKNKNSDIKNNKITYIDVLGLDAAKAKAKELTELALKTINTCDISGTDKLMDLAKYLISRKN